MITNNQFRRIIFGSLAVLVISMGVFNININSQIKDKTTLLILANVEALANNENIPCAYPCYRNYTAGGLKFFRCCKTCSVQWFMSSGWDGDCWTCKLI